MTTYEASRSATAGRTRPAGLRSPAHHAAILGAVREDVRQTLRTAWVEPAIDAAAVHPVFFTAAWSAIRPNIGKTFLLLAQSLRTDAVDGLAVAASVPDLRKRLEADLGDEELRRIEETVRAAHQATVKAQIVVHALLRAARRERVPGTGREEPPVRRGIPDWQRWMSFQPPPPAVLPILEDALESLGTPALPATLRLLSRWPLALARLWDELAPVVGKDGWRAATVRLRRAVLAGIRTLPHPIELQWMALRERGFSEEDRLRVADALAEYDAAMSHCSLVATFAWLAFGAPEVSLEG